ncbi:MAG TPA: metallophosphoesterase [Desulfosporosinus sp.]|nr:metallophosphoesterase [Desulfosporosinus sp.]
MWGLISTAFLGIYCLMSFYIGRRGWKIVGKSMTNSRKIYWIFLGLLILTFSIAEVAQDWLPQSPALWLTIAGWYTMIAVVYLCLLLIIIDSLRLLDSRIQIVPKVIRDHDQTPKVVASLILMLVTIILIYGSWNARHPVITRYELSVDKEAGSLDQLRIAMVSDIHYGAIIDAPRLTRMLEVINELQPDVIVMSGDIVDGTVKQEEAQKLIKLIKQMQAKYSIFAVPGNHDRWIRSDADLVHSFQEAGAEVLRDSHIKVADSFYIVGRDDPGHRRDQGRKDLEELMQGIDPSLTVILLDHQPIDIEAAENNRVDLQLSGHTHMGQIFPSHLITSRLYAIDWGLLTKGSYHLIVSSGYGTWGPPLRIGTNPEIVEVTLKFKK